MKQLTLDFLDGSSADAGELARLHAKEWQHLYREWDEKKALHEFRSQKSDGSIPATLVLREDGRLVGSVSVLRDDCEARRDLGLWLASLYVMPEKRGQGHSRRLIEAAIALAKQNNAGCLHVFTESAEQLFLHHGFTRFTAAATNGRAITILRRDI